MEAAPCGEIGNFMLSGALHVVAQHDRVLDYHLGVGGLQRVIPSVMIQLLLVRRPSLLNVW